MTALIDAWQRALAAEHQADFGYALVGAHLHLSPHRLFAAACSKAHDTTVLTTSAALAQADQVPVSPEADYPALYPVTDAGSALALAVRLEVDCAAAWRYLYLQAATAAVNVTPIAGSRSGSATANPASYVDRLRAQAQAELTASAVRATKWRLAAGVKPATVAFPGL